MRVVRLVVLALVLALAYFAQYLFDTGSLSHFYPTWAMDRFPFLARTALWLAEDLYTLALWLMVGCAVIFGLITPTWNAVRADTGEADPARQSIRRGELLLLGLLLAGALVLFAWGGTGLPAHIAPIVAQAGLQAQALFALGGGQWLQPTVTGAPQVAYLPAAVAMAVAGNAMTGARLAGLVTALVLLVGVWLLARELFRVSPHGHGLALLAVGFTAATVPMLHFARLAPYLPATAAGTWAAFALLVAVRNAGTRRAAGWAAASGVLAALALWLDRSGAIFAPLLLLWWLGLWLLAAVRKDAAPVENNPASQWLGRLLAVWAAALVLVAAPLVIGWLVNPIAWSRYWNGGLSAAVAVDWWANLRLALGGLFRLPDASTVLGVGGFGFGGHFIPSAVAPLAALGLGALLFNLDRLVGWCVLTWLCLGLLLAGVLPAAAPNWPVLLPLLPVVGLSIAFALDRIAALWIETGTETETGAETGAGVETESGAGSTAAAAQGSAAAASLAAGLLLATAFFTWVGYYSTAANPGAATAVPTPPGQAPAAQARVDQAAADQATAQQVAASYTARALGNLPSGRVGMLVYSTPEPLVRLDDPIVQFGAGARARQALSVPATALPASLPPQSQLLVQASDTAALAAVRGRFPQGEVETVRDLGANPHLFIVRLP